MCGVPACIPAAPLMAQFRGHTTTPPRSPSSTPLSILNRMLQQIRTHAAKCCNTEVSIDYASHTHLAYSSLVSSSNAANLLASLWRFSEWSVAALKLVRMPSSSRSLRQARKIVQVRNRARSGSERTQQNAIHRSIDRTPKL